MSPVRVAALLLAVSTAVACAGPRRAACPPSSGALPGIDRRYETTADVVAAFDALERAFVERRDGRGAFHSTYRLITLCALRRAEAGDFEDNAYVDRAVVVFANYYREALLAYERRDRAAVPPIWCIAFDAARFGRTSWHQCVLLGISAHIRDLAYTVADLGTEPARRYRDYTAVNGVLSGATDRIQRRLCRLYHRDFCTADGAFLFLDEGIVNGWMENIREEAWREGAALERATSDAARRTVRRRIQRTSLERARWILSLPVPRR